ARGRQAQSSACAYETPVHHGPRSLPLRTIVILTRPFSTAAPYPRSRHSFMIAHSLDEDPVDTGSAASWARLATCATYNSRSAEAEAEPQFQPVPLANKRLVCSLAARAGPLAREVLMRRREVIATLAAVAAGPLLLPAHAQTSGVRRIGVIYHGGPYEVSIEGLREGLRATGLEEGLHVALLLRNSQGDAAAAEAAARALERDDKVDVIMTFYNPGSRTAVSALEVARQAASKVDIAVAAHPVTSPREIRDRLRTLAGADGDAFFFMSDALVTSHSALIVETANALGLPTMAHELGIVRSGALAGYGPDFRAVGRRPASYVARILAGSLPGDLSIEAFDQPALAINLKTAKAIGLDIPPLLLTRSDEVIE
ncbi:MAG: ABC transporter substrate binding protein, partial [Microvirga sp.]